jgi:YggT family protein
VRNFIGAFLQVYLALLFCRAVMSWFPIRDSTVWVSLYGVVFRITEPVLRPARGIIPPVGMFDLSFIVVVIGIIVLRGIVAGV